MVETPLRDFYTHAYVFKIHSMRLLSPHLRTYARGCRDDRRINAYFGNDTLRCQTRTLRNHRDECEGLQIEAATTISPDAGLHPRCSLTSERKPTIKISHGTNTGTRMTYKFTVARRFDSASLRTAALLRCSRYGYAFNIRSFFI